MIPKYEDVFAGMVSSITMELYVTQKFFEQITNKYPPFYPKFSISFIEAPKAV